MSDNPFREDGSDLESPPGALPASPQPQATAPSGEWAPGVSRLEQLRRREQELLRELQRLNDSRVGFLAAPNYPAIFPLVIYDPERDIPERAKSCIRNSLYGLFAVVASALFNIVAVLCVWGLPTYQHVRCLIFAIIQGFGTAYVVFNYSYTKLYNSLRQKDVPFSWVIWQFAILAWCIYLTIGFPDSGCVGLATFLDLIAKSSYKFSMMMALINTFGIGAATYFQFVTLYQAQAYQKVSGHDQMDETGNALLNQ